MYLRKKFQNVILQKKKVNFRGSYSEELFDRGRNSLHFICREFQTPVNLHTGHYNSRTKSSCIMYGVLNNILIKLSLGRLLFRFLRV